MYADRYADRRGPSPGGIAFALGASGFLVFGLSLSAPHFVRDFDPVLIGRNIPVDPSPPIREKPRPQPQVKNVQPVPASPDERVDVTPPPIPAVSGGLVATTLDPPIPLLAVGTGDIGAIVPQPHIPVLRDPTLDARYADAFQPAYPSDERLAGHEGRVVVRVLIGADGQVKEVQQVSAASSAFFEATRRQALARWRFKPGTKDGVAVEAWHVMAVRFVLDEA